MAKTNLARTLHVYAMLLSIGCMIAVSQQNYLDNWPPGTSPQEVGKRVAEHFVTSPHQGDRGRTRRRRRRATKAPRGTAWRRRDQVDRNAKACG